MIKQHATTLTIAAAGMVSSEAADAVTAAADIPAEEVVKILIQLVIGVATLVKMFKKKKEANNGNDSNPIQ